ncbi:MAG: hypothetical protein RBT30_02135 [Patescibacteria group bacterium]|jgi:hypothetical protein|nr:hypothetical protein [Patescibacteria group bacterium]
MDKLRNRPFWQVLVAAIVVAVVCNVFFGWSFWLVISVILSFWVAEKTTKWLYVVTVVLIGVQAFNAFLPQTAKKSSWVTTATDLFIGSKVDSVQIKANIILEKEKNLQKDKLLPKYHDLIKKGRVEEAQALLDSLDNIFSPKKKKDIVQQIPDPTPTIAPVVLGGGAHKIYMKAGDISNFKILSPRFCVNTDQRDMATLVYPDGNVVHLWQTAVLPSGTEFSLKSLVDQFVIIKVS